MTVTDGVLGVDAESETPRQIMHRVGVDELGIHLLFVEEEFVAIGGGAVDVYRVCEA
jgi:hypothetical protein